MSEGKMDFHGPSSEIEQNEDVKKAYLGI